MLLVTNEPVALAWLVSVSVSVPEGGGLCPSWIFKFGIFLLHF